MEQFDRLREILEGCEEDLDKFERGNKAAGTRLRKLMQEVKKQAQAVREAVLAERDPSGK